jgi:manganese transport protein
MRVGERCGLMSTATEPSPRSASRWAAFRRFLGFVGPGFLVSVGYMDPGNWATDLAGGSQFGYALLWVILLSNLMAILLQHLCVRLNVATGQDLAQACRARYSPTVSKFLWLSAQVGIVACDLAELLGSAIALQILFKIPLFFGAIITALDVLVLLALTRLGYRWLESLVAVLVLTIAACVGVELLLAKPELAALFQGFVPTTAVLTHPGMLFVALGIIGATVMPHNLYLHSSIVGQRAQGSTEAERREAMRFATYDSTLALTFAFFVNAGLLVLSAAVFHQSGQTSVTDIREAHRLLDGALGSTVAGTLFAVALLASGQNATITGTLAGQIVLEGFLKVKSPGWIVRAATRLAALIPALLVIGLAGEGKVETLLIWSQVILSLQLGFACWPLVRMTSDATLMGAFVAPRWLSRLGWAATAVVVVASLWFVVSIGR